MVLEVILILLILLGIFLCWKIYEYQPFKQSTPEFVLHEIVVHEGKDEEEICDQKYKSKRSKTKRHKSKRSKTCKKASKLVQNDETNLEIDRAEKRMSAETLLRIALLRKRQNAEGENLVHVVLPTE
jgi:cell division protein YceG involved in septum cleavage